MIIRSVFLTYDKGNLNLAINFIKKMLKIQSFAQMVISLKR